MDQQHLKAPQKEIILQNISFLKDKKFTVEEYQRGYKWGKAEILQLLGDIDEHDPAQGIYCLQPLILHDRKDTYEIIDGQQRCTSIYLILQYLLKGGLFFSIDYRTRGQSSLFLIQHLQLLDQVPLLDPEDLDDLTDTTKLSLYWQDFIRGVDLAFNNVDIYHFFLVYLTIRSWFQNKDQDQHQSFLGKLLQEVNFIWYEIDTNEKEEDFSERFLNFNKGKISLTSSELIKALFILDIKRSKGLDEIKELKITELALEWDGIERQLHDDGFWFFICDQRDIYNKGTRIDLLFDLLCPQTGKRHNDMFAYRSYETIFNTRKSLNWPEVKAVFQRLMDWYENKELYHHVGYLIITRIKSLREIYLLSEEPKDKFLTDLKKAIQSKFAEMTNEDNPIYKYDPINVNFEVSTLIVHRILLLFNVVFYIKNPSKHRFPFELYVEQEWTIEHINPQNPKGLMTIEEYTSLAKEYFSDTHTDFTKEVLDFLQSLAEKTLSELDKKQHIRLSSYFEKISVDFNIHDLGNLTLLDRNTNSSVGNGRFWEKRKKILQYDADGKYLDNGTNKAVFIPLATKNIFSKNYTLDEEALKNTYWTHKDQICYLDEIRNQLSEYLPKISE